MGTWPQTWFFVHCWAWMWPNGEVGLWGWFAGGLGDLCYCLPGDPSLSPAPPPHVYALRKGGLSRRSSCFHKVFAESRPSLGAWMTKNNWAEERVTIPTSVQSTAWFWNAGGLKGIQSHFGTLKGCITRTRGCIFDTEAQLGPWTVSVEGPPEMTSGQRGARPHWNRSLAARSHGRLDVMMDCTIHDLVWDRLPETIRGDFFGVFFGGGVVVLHKQVALRIILFISNVILLTAIGRFWLRTHGQQL